MQEIDAEYRPDEIGSPWAISGPGYFTDGGHQDHVHLGFKTEIDPNWKPPAEVPPPAARRPGRRPPPPAAVAAAAPGQPAAAAAAAEPPKPKAGDSMSFRAVTAKDAAEAAAPKKGDALRFMACSRRRDRRARSRPPAAVPAVVADAADGDGRRLEQPRRLGAGGREGRARQGRSARRASTPAPRSTSTSRRPASAPATRGARAS